MNLADPMGETEIVVLNLSDQVFTFVDSEGGEWHWNASLGMRIVEASGRAPCAFYPSDHGLDIPQLQRQYETLDLEYAKTTDLTRPILFVPFHDGTSILCDGWHRLAKSILLGVPCLLCYELTEAERDQILVLHIPPKPKPQALPARLQPMAPTNKHRPKGGLKKT
jgi:hypothetical protein